MKADQSIKLYVTKVYDKFHYLPSNRPIDRAHVQQIKHLIEENGNLSSEMPIKVDKTFGIIDGQHTLEALKELGYPVYYVISDTLTEAHLTAINIGRKNWSWQDYAHYYANKGSVHYKDLLELHEIFPHFGQHTLVRYCNNGKGINTAGYQKGDFTIIDRGRTFGLLNQLTAIREVLPFKATQGFYAAMYDILSSPDYEQKKMREKLTKYGSQLREWSKRKDWIRNLEDIYNFANLEENRVRFF